MHWLNLLFVLLTNGVPLYGVKLLGWSATTYWGCSGSRTC